MHALREPNNEFLACILGNLCKGGRKHSSTNRSEGIIMANQQQTQRQHEQTNPSQVAATATQFDQQAYKEALRRTSAQTFAQTAASMAASPAMGPLQNPNLIHLILADHANVNTLFSHFFQASCHEQIHHAAVCLKLLDR
jgi:hypothetical protein